MTRVSIPLFPSVSLKSRDFGDRLRLARLRRKIKSTEMAERVGISRDTLNRLEAGDPAVSLGNYLRVMKVLGLDSDLDAVASDDKLGRKLQDIDLETSISRPTPNNIRKSSKP